MGRYLAWKLSLGIVGTLTALAGERVGAAWLFAPGLAMVVVALLLPTHPGQTWREKLSLLVRHLPLARWFGRDTAGSGRGTGGQ